MLSRPDWELEGRDWPNREASRFVSAGGLRWHVQRMGRGPVLLLAHGTGAATHSWRDLAPLLAQHFDVVAPDLPGHGFTQSPGAAGMSLPRMAAALAALIDQLGAPPDLALGHSAGAAILARLCLDGRIAPRALISLNGALLPLSGLAGQWYAPAAKFFAQRPLLARAFAWRAKFPGSVKQVVDSTGSRLDDRGLDLYRRLATSPGHVASAVEMMANWDLVPMQRDLSRLATPLILAVAEKDTTVRPAEARKASALLPTAEIRSVPGLGHLAHEERPDLVADLVLEVAAGYGLVPATA